MENSKDPKVIKMTGILVEVKSRRDAGTRIIIDVGSDSIEGILELQKLNSSGDIAFAIAITPFGDGKDEVKFDEWKD